MGSARWVRAVTALGYEPRDHGECERLKADGYAILNKRASTPSERVRGAELVLQAQFDRSLVAAILGGYWRAPPLLATYIAMRDLSVFSEPVAEDLRRKYGPRPGGIGDGRSYWEPNGASNSPHPSLRRAAKGGA